jgi:2-polyprenyl-3-methyl-5-hydroxy-6-metoxy-1,4-benzoquinol methylase
MFKRYVKDHKNSLISSGLLMNNAKNYNKLIFQKICPYIQNGTNLEIGPGTGNFSTLIQDVSKKLTIVDEKKASIEYLKKKFRNNKKITIIKNDLFNLNFQKHFDTIILLNVLEHIENDIKAVEKLLLMLKKNGILIIQVPSFNFLFSNYDKLIGHIKRYTKKDFLSIRKKINFKILDMHYFNTIGALGWWLNYCLLKKTEKGKSSTVQQLKFYDKYLVPLINFFDFKFINFGISLFVIIKK